MNKLIKAILDSDRVVVKKCISEEEYNPDGNDSCIDPPLVTALNINLQISLLNLGPSVKLANIIIISSLLNAGADINLKGKSGLSAYEIADRFNLKSVKKKFDNIHNITLFNAVECNSLKLVRMTLRLPSTDINHKLYVNNEEEISALTLALVKINLKIAIHLVKANIVIEASDIKLIEDIATYLFAKLENTSCKKKKSRIKRDIELLYNLLINVKKKYPSVKIINVPYDTSLISALKQDNYTEALKLTLSVRNINLLLPATKESALSLAIESEHIAIVYSILNKGANFRGNADIIATALKNISCLNKPIIHKLVVESIVKENDIKTFWHFIRFLELSKTCIKILLENIVKNKMWRFVRAFISLDIDIPTIQDEYAPIEANWYSKQKKGIIYLADNPKQITKYPLKP